LDFFKDVAFGHEFLGHHYRVNVETLGSNWMSIRRIDNSVCARHGSVRHRLEEGRDPIEIGRFYPTIHPVAVWVGDYDFLPLLRRETFDKIRVKVVKTLEERARQGNGLHLLDSFVAVDDHELSLCSAVRAGPRLDGAGPFALIDRSNRVVDLLEVEVIEVFDALPDAEHSLSLLVLVDDLGARAGKDTGRHRLARGTGERSAEGISDCHIFVLSQERTRCTGCGMLSRLLRTCRHRYRRP